MSRCYGFTNTEFGQVQLHIFADASQYAYGSNLYSLFTPEFYSLQFFYCEIQTSPNSEEINKYSTIRTTSSCTKVRPQDTCIEELQMKVDNAYFYIDSKAVINYICNDYFNFGIFVTHRIHEIRNKSEPKQWYYVPSKLKVADDTTRCVNVQKLQNNCRWFNGPKFLYEVYIEEYLI